MKKVFISPELSFVEFQATDIITASVGENVLNEIDYIYGSGATSFFQN